MDVAANPVVKSFLAGSFSGTCSTILFQPLDLVKTRIQRNHQLTFSNGLLVEQGQGQVRSNTMFSVVRQVLKHEQISGLWRGIVPSITRTVPGVGIYFSSLHWLKSRTTGDNPAPAEAILLGMGARSFAGAVMIPITVLKTRFESGNFHYTRMSTALAAIWAKEGARGLTCGLVPTLLRDAPYSGLYLMFYTQLKQHAVASAHKMGVGDDPTVALGVHFSCGVGAGLLASAVTHPADVVKTQMQLDPAKFSGSAIQASKAIYQASGASGFFVGIAPRMLRRTLMSALAWTVYEEVMRQTGLK